MADIKYLKPTEITGVLAEAKRHGTRTHLMFLLGFSMGLRVSEIAGIRIADIANGHISVTRLKGSDPVEDRVLVSHDNPLFDERKALAAWLKDRGSDASEFLFTSREGDVVCARQIQRLFNRCAIRAGVNPERAHTH